MAKASTTASIQILILLLTTCCLARSKPIVTKMTIYIQEYQTGPRKSVFQVAGLPDHPHGRFGNVYVADNNLTTDLSADSSVVGHLYGFSAVAGLDGVKIEALFTVLFTGGKYNGSTVELKGLNQQTLPVKELAIVGGTKEFRFATGYANFETAGIDGGHHILRLNLTIVQDESLRQEMELDTFMSL